MIDPPPEPQPGATSTLPTRPAGSHPAPPTDSPVTSTLPTRPVGSRPAATPFTPESRPVAAGASSRSRAIVLAGAAILILVIVVASVMLSLNPAPNTAGATGSVPLGEVLAFDSQGNTHIAKGQPHPTYNSDPPNSGWHREEFPPDNTKFVYDQPLDDEVSVHLMEHGNLIAWYSCGSGVDCGAIRDSLARETQKLGEAPFRIYVMPRATLPGGAHIALGAWQHIEYLKDFDQQKVTDFIQRFGARVQENMPVATPKP